MTDDERRRRLLVGVGASIAVHAIVALVIALMPTTSVVRSLGPDMTASSSRQTRGFSGDTSSGIAKRPRRPSPRTGGGANGPSSAEGRDGTSSASPGQTGAPRGESGQAPPRDAGAPSVPASGDSSLSGQTSETPGTASILGRVTDANLRPVAGVTI